MAHLVENIAPGIGNTVNIMFEVMNTKKGTRASADHSWHI